MGILNKISEYNQRKMSEDPAERFAKQVKGSFISTAVIIGLLFIIIIVLVIINAISSIFS